ncbi:MerR family transcriptional regulator [Actinotalea fermentans]|uniref:MerR family transcriptional regulator n=1 Tax=Actinotalea fermentans TaxID=43671 RepID=A0A511YW06_9CELL|nr:MerR family transcriptional regulator [Actinotalea fermentans]KGM15960.1 MerR family transcriptional regulator [Actinotalea fermentans ATCC 43279 = JCM 9966 = DSM 3133]GEN79375.1 MerR family transcriptional regulator [Actinotalea fermentans]
MHSIQEVARASGTTSRTLRHYEAVGVLPATEVGAGGTRYYDDDALVRLQEALVLRSLGMPLAEVRAVLDGERDRLAALRRHLAALQTEQRRLTRMAASVARTIDTLETGGPIVAEEMFDGFDHTQYQAEVEQRWGADAYATGDRWWRGMSDDERRSWQERTAAIAQAWAALAAAGVAPDSDEAQDVARRHAAWLASIPGTPGYGTGAPDKGYVLGLADMYVADPRFAANYGGEPGATLVRDALRVWVERSA